MSWTDIRQFFDSRLETLGFTKWDEAFDTDNIPSTVVDYAYHLIPTEFTGEGQNQSDVETLVQIELQFIIKGFRTPSAAVDTAVEKAEDIIEDLLVASQRLTQTFKNVIFIGMTIEPFAEQNDNIARARMQFSVRDIIQAC